MAISSRLWSNQTAPETWLTRQEPSIMHFTLIIPPWDETVLFGGSANRKIFWRVWLSGNIAIWCQSALKMATKSWPWRSHRKILRQWAIKWMQIKVMTSAFRENAPRAWQRRLIRKAQHIKKMKFMTSRRKEETIWVHRNLSWKMQKAKVILKNTKIFTMTTTLWSKQLSVKKYSNSTTPAAPTPNSPARTHMIALW